jgi:hypothetical protein
LTILILARNPGAPSSRIGLIPFTLDRVAPELRVVSQPW